MGTTQLQQAKLKNLGFFRADGLPTYKDGAQKDIIRARSGDLGHWGHHKGKMVIVTICGEVWLADYLLDDDTQVLIGELANVGEGAFVPCTNGDHVLMSDMLRRMRNPSLKIYGE